MALVFRNGQWVQDDVDVNAYRARMQSPEVQRMIQLLAARNRQTARPASRRRAVSRQAATAPRQTTAVIPDDMSGMVTSDVMTPVVARRDPYEATTPDFVMMDGARVPVGALSPIESDQSATYVPAAPLRDPYEAAGVVYPALSDVLAPAVVGRDPYEATTPEFVMMDGARVPVGALSPVEQTVNMTPAMRRDPYEVAGTVYDPNGAVLQSPTDVMPIPSESPWNSLVNVIRYSLGY